MRSSRACGWSFRNPRLVSIWLGVVFSAFTAIAPLSAVSTPAAAQTSCRTVGSFAVCGRFLDEWGKGGSDQADVYVNGLPITSSRQEISLVDGKSYDTQWFERAKYEAHPENKAPYDVQLGLLGSSLVEGRGVVDPYTKKVRNASDQPFVGIDKPADADGKSKVWFPETRHSVGGKILEYWNRYGGLKQFGFPLSEPFQEISEADNKPYTVQYFERNRFELHPEKQAPYEVELGLLGVQQYMMTPVAGDKLPVAPPVGVKSSKDTLVLVSTGQPADTYIDGSGGLYNPLWYDLWDRTPQGDQFGELAWYLPTIENGGARFVGSGDDRHLQVKYKIRPGMRWSDGVEITSNDAIFAYKVTTNPNFESCCLVGGDAVYNVDNPDKYTAIYNFLSYSQEVERYTQDKEHFAFLKVFIDQKKPATQELYSGIGDVLPEHTLSKVAPGTMVQGGYWSDPKLMVSSGPFKLERWDQGQQIVLVPNPYYTLTAPPILKRIIYRVVPDYDTLIAQLKSGDADAAVSDTLPNAPDEQIRQLQQAGLTVNFPLSNGWEHLDFNLDRPYFQDKAVRQAIAYAINRQKIADDASSGTWRVMNSMIIPQSWGSEENPTFPSQLKEKYPLHHYPYDPTMANRLLDQAGWVRGSDGIRAKGGVRLSFNYTTSGGLVRARVLPIVSQNLLVVGIDARPIQLSQGDLFNSLGDRNFDLAEFAYNSRLAPEAGQLNTAAIPTEANPFGGNYTGYSNPHFDDLDNRAESEIVRAQTYPLWAEMQSIITEDLPTIPLFIRSKIEVHASNLMNWETGTVGNAMYKAQAMYFK